ncbi:hypothetical protein [Glaesserella sp.]|uniref:hypothetical protein n=1 Tax=Glaesserella sp. TaxID=2094731 RepID=UPI0035A0DE5C
MRKTLLATTTPFFLAGCLSTNIYTNNNFQQIKQENLQQPKYPIPVRIEAQLMRNDEVLHNYQQKIQNDFENAFTRTKVIVIDENSDKKIKATLNNIANIAQAIVDSQVNSLTLGLIGQTAIDNYQFVCNYSENGKRLSTKTYQHQLVTTLGNEDVPKGNFTWHANFGTAVEMIIQDLTNNCVADLQGKGYLK